MTIIEASEGQLAISLDPSILQVSDAISYFSTQTELLDVSVSDITTEDMVASLYKEYRI